MHAAATVIGHRRQKTDRVLRYLNVVHRRWHCYVASSISNHIWIVFLWVWVRNRMDDGCCTQQLIAHHSWQCMTTHTTSDGLVFIRMIAVDTATRMVSCKHKIDGRCMMVWLMYNMLYWDCGCCHCPQYVMERQSSVRLYNLLFPIFSECGYLILTVPKGVTRVWQSSQGKEI